MDKLTIADLRNELEARGLDTCGSKMELLHRLGATGVGAMDNDVQPDDSASQVTTKSSNSGHSSRSSQISMDRIKEKANKAGLLAKAALLKQKRQKELDELKLRQEKEELEIQAEIAETEARENVLAEFEEGSQVQVGNAGLMAAQATDTGVSMTALRVHTGITTNDTVPPLAGDSSTQRMYIPHNLNAEIPASLHIRSRPQSGEPGVRERHMRKLNAGAPCFEPHAEPVSYPDVKTHFPTRFEQQPVYSRVDQKAHDQTLLEAIVSANQRALLPKSEISKFGGDMVQYRSFIRSFESQVCSRISDNEERLYYLEQYTIGTPKEIVRGCLHMPQGQGYERARFLLHKRYGDEEAIVSAHVAKIVSWPTMKADDVQALDNFSIMLVACKNAMEGISMNAREIEHPKTLRKIVEKLPYSMQDRWRRKVGDISDRECRPITFSDLVNYIEKEVSVLSHPIFGKHVMGTLPEKPKGSDSKHTRTGGSLKPRINFVAGIGRREKAKLSCTYCKGEHFLADCGMLRALAETDKKAYIKRNNLCFGCLRAGHNARDCKNRRSCHLCHKLHPTILHREVQVVNHSGSTEGDTAAACNRIDLGRNASSTGMSIIPVVLHFNSKAVQTYAFLDNGSSASFCSKELMSRLFIDNATPTRLALCTVNGVGDKIDSARITGLHVSDPDSAERIPLPPLYLLDKMPVSRRDILKIEDLASWSHLQAIDIPEFNEEVGLLLGNNVPKAFEPLEIINSPDEGGPFAIRTRLGWVVSGHQFVETSHHLTSVNKITLEAFFKGIEDQEFSGANVATKAPSVEDKLWEAKVKRSCKLLESGKYEICLPFRDDQPSLPNNRSFALKRLSYLKKKFERDEKFYEDYKGFVSNMLDKGFAEPAQPHNSPISKEISVWYIPHHGVYHPHKPGKIRVVFDCAAKCGGVSLNDTLLQGPDLTNPLTDVLIRFRQDRIAFIGDIDAMFHQVSVPERDRDYLRFLWWPNGNYNASPKEYRMTVHLFGATSSPSCANFALRQTAEANSHNYIPEATSTIVNNFYVDDCLKSVNSIKSAVHLVSQLRSLCGRGGFNLTKFVSNNRDLIESIPNECIGKNAAAIDMALDCLPAEMALGIQWNPEEDRLCVSASLPLRKPTKRGILSTVGSLYDPLGIVAPFLLKGRKVLQELSRLALGWDDEIPRRIRMEWEDWCNSWLNLKSIGVDRCIKPDWIETIVACQLHHFSDASEKGYGMVTYARFCGEGGKVHLAFIFGKARVSPLKQVTIPRLELVAATLSVRISGAINRALEIPIDGEYFWTDSTTVLRYIHNRNSRFKTFVANRLAIIHEGSQVHQWHYVNTTENPADDASRGEQSSRWLLGPSFLHNDEEGWPRNPLEVTDADTSDLETRKPVIVNQLIVDENPLDKLINYYSSWHQLKRACAWLLRVRNSLVNKLRLDIHKPLDTEELKKSEIALIKIVQSEVFSAEIRILSKGKDRVMKSSPIYKLNPILHDDILRVGGRLDKANLDYDTKHPVILPGKTPISHKIITEFHQLSGHQGREYVLGALREKFWLINGSTVVRKVLRECLVCRKYLAKPMSQQMSNLPEDRVTPYAPPFSSTGVDCFGPFMTKGGRSHRKRYGLLFTCMAIRAVHIEVLDSMSTSSFLNALRRFIARRGQVKILRSDRGTNFVGAEKELNDLLPNLDHALIQRELVKQEVDWIFNPPYASHFGGVWERQIRSVRKVVSVVMREQTLCDDNLHTLFCEIEAIINSRPLTVVSDDPNDLGPLTPNHLLTMKDSPVVGDNFVRADLCSRKRWRQVQYLADLFWKRWQREYITLMQVRQKWMQKKENLKPGDVVLLVDEALPRCHWKMGRVSSVKVSVDGLVRSATLKVGTIEYTRPITKLVLLCES